ncbi:PBECR3 domain-containing polyvalent protein [Phenylobacterium sp.]|uniref:PBECR3 domain-containing polyvalent protein n=1 Tax=Phenylobacterium sp. TaxID=1871053 RepID=UPI002FC6C287
MPGFAVTQGSALNSEPEMAVGAKAPTPFWSAVETNFEDATQTRNAGVREELTRTELWARHRAIEEAAGRKLALPLSISTRAGEIDPIEKFTAPIIGGINAAITGRPGALTDEEYEREVETLRAEKGAAFKSIETREALRARLDAGWKATRQKSEEAWTSPGGAAGGFLGQAAGAMMDPGNAGLTIATGGAGAARPLAARMLTQAAVNAGIEGLQAPDRAQDAREFGGPAYKPSDAALDIAAGATGGALVEGGVAGVRAAARPLIRQFVGAGEGAPRRAAQILATADLDDAAIGVRAGEDHAAATEALERLAPAPRVAPDRELSELFAGGEGTTDYKGRPIHAGRFDPAAVAADPVRFQYKADGDAEGVTARLRGIEAWDPTASGKVLIFEDRAGGLFIADGHQRRGLALRMVEKGWDAELDGYLFREAEGWRASEVRTVAALKNIREGQGSPLDAAKVFRQAPEAMADRSLPVTGDFMAKARGLAQLSDEAFGAAVNKVIPEAYAADVGAMASTRPDLHMDMVRLLKEADPANGDEARALIVEALQDDWIKREGDQVDLFGYDASTSAMIGRAKIAAAVKRSLARDARLFSQLVKHADAIETGGNALARDANEARLALDRAALEITAKLSLRAGPIGEAMAAAAQKVAKGEAPATAAKDVLTRVREAIEAGESFEGARARDIAPEPPSEAARALLGDFEDAIGKGAEAQAKGAPEDAAFEGQDMAALVRDRIATVLDAAAGPGHAPAKAVIGEASDWLVAAARDAGLEIQGFTHTLDGSAVRHVRANHGDPAKEAARGQVAVTDEDLQALPEILSAPDAVAFGAKGKRGQDQIFYLKEQPDGSTLVAEEVRTGRKDLALLSVRRYPAAIDDARLAKLVDPNALNDGGDGLKIVRAPADASAVADEGPPPGLFDDLPEVGAYDKAHKALGPCAPGE